MIVFKDKDGKILAYEWNPKIDPEKYSQDKRFPDGWKFERVTLNEFTKLIPPHPMLAVMPLSPAQRIKALEKEHNALIDELEVHLKLQKGQLRIKIKGGENV